MTESETLLLGNTVIQVIRSRRRTLSIEVGLEGVKARAPMRMAKQSIADFLMTKQHWIERHLAELPPPQVPFQFDEGIEIHLHGEPVEIRFQRGSRKPVYRQGATIVVPIVQSHLPIEQSAKRKLVVWLKKQALEQMHDKVGQYAKQMNVPASKKLNVTVRDYKRRWGSCDHLGNLSFNWRIILASDDIMDYVVIHELAHCLEFNHSRRFWHIVEQQMSNWKDKKNWLDRNGTELYLL